MPQVIYFILLLFLINFVCLILKLFLIFSKLFNRDKFALVLINLNFECLRHILGGVGN
jgi:hypothetical protein